MASRFIRQFASLLDYTKGLEKITGQSAFVVPYAEDYLAELKGASMSTTETKVRHTPGPWEVHTFNDFNEFEIHPSNDEHGDFTIADLRRGTLKDERAANAHLIASAPDMLEALEAAMRTLETIHAEDDISIDADVLAAGRAAIQKARGGAA